MKSSIKHKAISFFCLVLAIIPQFGFDQVKKAKTLKVISYNIWNGFDFGKDENRRNDLANWVKKQNPEVLALQELCGYTREKLLADAKKWGHDYAEILKTDGYPVGITSKGPITVKARVIENLHHGFLHCKTQGIDFFVVHFSPFSYKKRHKEANAVLNEIKKLRKGQNKYIVLGDFNALSPFDAHFYDKNETVRESMQATEKQHKHVRNLSFNDVEYGVMAKLIGFPLMDVVRKTSATMEDRLSYPTQVFEKEKGAGRASTSLRIDYILTSPFLASKCIDAKVLNKEGTYYLSDHYPVFAEFNLK